MHEKKKIEIIVEAHASRFVQEILGRDGAKGYTVLAPVAGKGAIGAWDASPITDAQRHVLIIAVVDAERVAGIVDEVGALLDDFHGIVLVSSVEVLRGDRF